MTETTSNFDPGTLPLDAAWGAVRELVPRTPCLPAPGLSECTGREVWLKYETLQRTGSFKVRGAAARMSALSEDDRRRGVVTCSSGNHGKAVSWVASRLGIPAIVCVPGWVDPVKRAAIEANGAEARLVGDSYDEAEAEAERIAREEDRVLVPPFDDPWIVAGQGSVAREILEMVPEPDEILVPLSGGGLVGGMVAELARHGLADRLTAVSASRADVMRRSLAAGRPVQVPEEETLASALAGGIGMENRVTFALVRDWVQRHEEVDEAAIRSAVRGAFRAQAVLLEGGGAVALAALLKREPPRDPPTGATVVVLSGGNLDPARLAALFDERD